MLFVVSVLLVCVHVASASFYFPRSPRGAGPTFQDWVNRHGKKYASLEELQKRHSIFLENWKKIKEWNAQETYGEAKFGLTQFSDMTPEEFKSYSQCHLPKTARPSLPGAKECWDFNDPRLHGVERTDVVPPASIDWRTKGAVTPVKNQGQCGSCWSFATTGTLEASNFLKWGKLISLSEQNLVDCSGKCCYNLGCDGGRVDWAIEYVVLNKGIDTEASYPYQAQDGTCRFEAINIGGNATNCITLPTGDETALMQAVGTIGPVAVAISVDNAFANYNSGVFTDNSCPNGADQLDHAVLVVGYGTENGQDYWLVKNSWGASWGDKGYIKMRRNYNNMCGIATDAVYPYY